VKVHTKVNYKGYVHHANRDDPQYEIKSDRTDHVALRNGSALRHTRRLHLRLAGEPCAAGRFEMLTVTLRHHAERLLKMK
jgi:hypothetical protein